MTALPFYGGPLKRDLIQQAYGICGQAGYEFEIEPEEFAAANAILDGMMYELRDYQGVILNYNFPEVGSVGNPEDESGIPYPATRGVVSGLAMRLAPSIGKTLSPESQRALSRSWTLLLANNITTPHMEMGRHTPRGAGNRWGQWRGPYFYTDTSPNEIEQ